MQQSKQDFLHVIEALKGKKEEYKGLKQFNNDERKRLKEEEKKANSFKFTKMVKKEPFLPSIHEKEHFEGFKSKEVGEKYIDSRQKFELLFPERAFEKKKKFVRPKAASNYFQRPIGQELDSYDEPLKKAMTSYDRDIVISKTKVRDEATGKWRLETRVERGHAKWQANSFKPEIFTLVKPLIDNTNTPRGARKAITLERNFDKDIWVYNKKSMDDFSQALKDQKRGKIIGKKIRKDRRMRQRSLSGSYNGSRSGSPTLYSSK